MRTICPEHGKECAELVNCASWRDQRQKDAEDLVEILRAAHQARVVDDNLVQLLNELSGPVPAVRDREEDPTLMIWAYALLVGQLMTEINLWEATHA